MKTHRHTAAWTLFLAIATACSARAQDQQKCPLPPAVSAPAGANIFTAERETELGELMAEQTDIRYQILQEPALTAYMGGIVNRLLSGLPPTGLKFQVILIDAPIVNAFSAPGGRIYVSRKLVSFLRNEDEMAGLLGHEIGHVVTHQSAIEMTMLFQKVLDAKDVTSREDLVNKYNQFLDNASRGTQAFRKIAHDEEPDQYIADQVALYSAANAGYSPRAMVGFFDRLAQAHGKTGSFFSNWFGLATPAEKRLGELQKALAKMPPGCGAAATTAAVSPEFQKWQSDVIGYSRPSQPENLPGLLSKRHLSPPLRGDFTHVRFSPDGQYALAQDESSIFVLTRLPFAFLFRIDAPGAHRAAFSPDSKDVVFSTPALRVEDWNVAGRKRVSAYELVVQDGCVQSLLSPDGKTMACLIEQKNSGGLVVLMHLDLQLFDVASGEAIFTKKQFLEENFATTLYLMFAGIRELFGFDLEPMAFSPDARSFVATSVSATVAMDVTTRNPINLRGPLKDMLKNGFAFLDSGRVIVENASNPAKSAILNFPSGEPIATVALGRQTLEGSAQGDYAMLRPVADARVGVIDVKTGKGVMALKQTSAMDIYNQQFIAQGTTGEVGLFDLHDMNFAAKVELPVSPLGPLRAQALSPDFRWLAVSGDTRGAIWDLSTMTQLYSMRGFRGGYFDDKATLYADFPKNDQVGRSIARADLSRANVDVGLPLDEQSTATEYGPYLISRIPNRKDKSLFQDVTLKVDDTRDGKTLWKLDFPKESPNISVLSGENRIILEWNAQLDSGKQEIKKYEALEKRFSAINDRAGVFLLEVLEAGTGHPLGAVLVDTGKNSFLIENGYAAGDWLLITDNENRLLIFSVASGELKGSVFGNRPIVSPAASLMGIENERGELQFYTLPQFEKVSRLSFSSPISMNRFNADGTRLFVMTSDQSLYVFDTSKLRPSTQSNTRAPN